jgi:hypothetical protein
VLRYPISRAVQLRRNLAYVEHAPPSPRSHLPRDASASEAESFIISRPWFTCQVEQAEFYVRTSRIPVEQLGFTTPGEDGQVAKWWKERGDWPPGWKWRHESPSPEPEDLTPLNTDGMDYSPSEVDALEAIEATPLPPPFTMALRWNGLAAGDTFRRPMGGWLEACWCFRGRAPDSTGGPEDQPAQVMVEEQPPNPPPRRRGRPRKQSQPAEVAAAPLTPPPARRRSARIAARHADPVPPPPPIASRGTRTRMLKGRSSALMPRNAPSAADGPKRRGRPRKAQSGDVTKLAAPISKRERIPRDRKAAVTAAVAAGAVNGT